ncbi:MAG: DUF4837 family protein [Melioribacteraceae bacterium]|nr:DUF4837 family protein [Melioribacteraceae bacterium]
MKRYFFLPVIFILSILIAACSGKRNAIGNEDEIIVVADSSEYLMLEPVLYETFSKVIYTPQPENLFNLIRKPYEELPAVKRKKNVIIVAPLNSGGYTSDYIKSILDSSVTDLVRNNKEFVFNKYDLWANDQLVMILTAPTIEDLEKKIVSNKDNLLHYFRKISDKRLFNSLYNARYERKDIEAKLLNNYGWIIYVQADFQLATDAPEDNFVWLRRAVNTDMERWIFVHWIDNVTPEWLNKDSITAIRDGLTEKYYKTTDNKNHVVIAQDQLTTFTEVNFLDKYAIMANGFWRFTDKSGGGPFISYTFYDEKTNRIYMLDGSIYAPKYYKKKLIQQVDVTLQSFLTKQQLSEDKIEDLLEELE